MLDFPKSKAIADDKLKEANALRFIYNFGANIVGKEGKMLATTVFFGLIFNLLLGTDTEWIEGNLWLVKSMSMFIQRAAAAIFACMIFFWRHYLLLHLIGPSQHWVIPLKINLLQDTGVCLFIKIFVVLSSLYFTTVYQLTKFQTGPKWKYVYLQTTN